MTQSECLGDVDCFLTIARPCDAVLTVKGSRFLARVAPVVSVARAESIIEEIRCQHRDATHHCHAFRVGYSGDRIERLSDAGEPSGTAGRPILEAMQSKKVWDAVTVITRYFGGVKLGTGGLKRAYRAVADAALSEAILISREVTSIYTLRFEHGLTGAVYRVAHEFKGIVTSTDFGSRVRMGITVKQSDGPSFCRRLADAGHGAVEVQFVGKGVR